MNEQPTLLLNSLRTPDGTVLVSLNRHDYVTYRDANGKLYMVDGGLAYQRRSANGDEEDLSVWSNDDHETKANHCMWGTYGKDGRQPLRWVSIRDMDSYHISEVIHSQFSANPAIIEVMEEELNLRGEH